jgi:hypothetical protein
MTQNEQNKYLDPRLADTTAEKTYANLLVHSVTEEIDISLSAFGHITLKLTGDLKKGVFANWTNKQFAPYLEGSVDEAKIVTVNQALRALNHFTYICSCVVVLLDADPNWLHGVLKFAAILANLTTHGIEGVAMAEIFGKTVRKLGYCYRSSTRLDKAFKNDTTLQGLVQDYKLAAKVPPPPPPPVANTTHTGGAQSRQTPRQAQLYKYYNSKIPVPPNVRFDSSGCRKYNIMGFCNVANCRWQHLCAVCGLGHPLVKTPACEQKLP